MLDIAARAGGGAEPALRAGAFRRGAGHEPLDCHHD
jgi:hypothetical protein